MNGSFRHRAGKRITPAGNAVTSAGQVDTSAGKPDTSLRATAIRMLARREYSRAELAERLASRGAAAEEVTRVLNELEQLDLLSDARFAGMLVAQKAGRFGKRAIAHVLTRRGIAAPAAQAALDTLNNADERADATAVWKRRFANAPKDERERARQIRFLLARGYRLSTALDVLRQVSSSADTEGE